MNDRYEKLQPSEQLFHDAQSILEPAGAIGFEDVDMTVTQEIIAQAKRQGIRCTYTHIVVRAVAITLVRHPDLNRLMLKKRLVYPATVDIGVAVHTENSTAAPSPEIVINDAGQKDLSQIGQEIIKRTTQVRGYEDQERHKRLDRLARIFFAAWMRRALFRRMRSQMPIIRKMFGTFHVSSLPIVKHAASLRFPNSAMLLIPRVDERPVVRNGQVVVRPICTMGLMVNRHMWDGSSMGIFFEELKRILESGELAAELPKTEVGAQAN